MVNTMKIVLTDFARSKHFEGDSSGTKIISHSPENFMEEVNSGCHLIQDASEEGYAPFCRLFFLRNWTDAKVGTLEINHTNERYLRTGYKARTDDELPVLGRWFEGVSIPSAKYLCLVLYSKEQLQKEGTEIDGDYGIVAILGQDHYREEPMPPITMMRNALGVDEGGSGVPLDRETYQRSVEFWSTHATVKQ